MLVMFLCRYVCSFLIVVFCVLKCMGLFLI